MNDNLKRTIIEMSKKLNSETDIARTNLKGHKDKFITDKSGNIRGNYVTNIKEAAKQLNKSDEAILAFNKFTRSVDTERNKKWVSINDNDLTAIQSLIETHFNFTPSTKELLSDGIELYAKCNQFNPIIDWIMSKKWDKKPRVDKLLSDYLGANDDKYSVMVSRKLCLGAISRLLHPGIKFELMPILYGHQGLGKSTLVEKLFGYSGYFTDNLSNMNAGDNNTILTLLRAWGVEISELSAIGKTKIENVKGFLSSSNPTYRELYHQRPSVFHNHCVFIGTTNNGDILADETGNRRFLPVYCGKNEPSKSIFKLNKSTVQQIWAEALCRYEQYCQKNKKHHKNNPKAIYLTESQNKLADKHRQQFKAFDPIEAAIKSFLNIKVPYDWNEFKIGKKAEYYSLFRSGYPVYDLNDHKLKANELVPIKITTMQEVIIVALDKKPKDAIKMARSNIGRRIDLAFHNMKNWRKKRANVNGKRIRAFVKI